MSTAQHERDDSKGSSASAGEPSFGTLVEQIPAGYFRLDRQGHFRQVNRAWLLMHGYDAPDEVIGRHYAMTQPDGDVAAAQAMIDRLCTGGTLPDGDVARRRKDGSLGYHTCSMRTVSQGGEVVGVQGFILDVTERRLSEQTLVFLAQYTALPGREGFFQALARFLVLTLDAAAVRIDRLDADGLTAHGVAVMSDGGFVDGGAWSLAGTAGGDVVGKHMCSFPAGVREMFPGDAMLREMSAEGYVGATLWNHVGQPIGMIATITRQPLRNRQHIEAVLQMVAVRAAGELDRLRVEAALSESQERMQFALDCNRIGAWELDLVDHSASRTLQHDRIFGYDQMLPEWTYEKFLEHVLPEDRAEVDRKFRKAMAEMGEWNFECRIVRRNGEQRWITACGEHVRDEHGRARRMSGVVQDITDLKRHEQSLLDSRQRLALAADSARFGIWDWDIRNDSMLWDEHMYRLYGIDGRTDRCCFALWKASLHPDDVASAMAESEAVLRGDRPYDTEFRVRHPDGAVRHIKAYGMVLRDAAGKPVRMLGINYDITELKAMESRLRDSEFFFKESQRAALIGSYRTDLVTGLWQTSEIMDDIFGIGPDYRRDIPGWLGLVHPEHREMMRIYLTEEVIGKQRPFAKQYMILRHRDGAVRWVDGRGKVSLDASGRPISLIGTIQDITERKQMEERLRQTEKLSSLGQLAGGVAHDFNNQLGGIMGYAEMLMKRAADPVTQRYATQILAASQRAADLTRELLAFARKGQYLRVPIDLHAIIAETTALLQRSIDRRIRIVHRLDAQTPTVLGDPTQLQNALLNLGLNARDAMPEGGTLTFATGLEQVACLQTDDDMAELAPGSYVQITVSDTGCGLSSEAMAHIFEPFFTTKGPGKGTGMGLAAVYGTVRKHEGAISIASEPGKGTVVRILLPAGDGAQQPVPPVQPSSTRLRQLRILVVDDEPVVRGMFADLLSEDGHTVVLASNGQEAVSLFRQQVDSFDLAILDMIMPVMNGRDCFRALRAISPNLRVLLASGFSLEDEARAMLAEGVRGVIRKPFLKADLLHTIAAALEG